MSIPGFLSKIALVLMVTLVSTEVMPSPLSYNHNVWTPVGPPGGLFVKMTSAKDKRFGDKLFVLSYWTDLFMSDDDGQTWQVSLDGNESTGHVYQLFAANQQVAYATVQGGRLDKTIDGGHSWASLSLPLGEPMFDFAGVDENHLFAFSGRDKTKLYRTTDGGMHWQPCVNPLHNKSGEIVAYSPDVLFVFEYDSQSLWRSKDAGQHWQRSAVDGNKKLDVSKLDVVGDVLYLLVDTKLQEDFHLYRSTDKGEHWSKVSNHRFRRDAPISFASERVGYRVSRGNCDYGNVYKTTDGGQTWQILTHTLPKITKEGIYASDENSVFVITQAGIYHSADGGQTWHRAAESIGAHQVNQIASYDGDSVYLITNRGLFYHSPDKGRSWQLHLNSRGHTFGGLMAVAPSEDKTVYLFEAGRGVLKSVDNGQHWQAVLANNDDQVADGVQLFSPRKDVVYENITSGFGYHERLLKSNDGGEHWAAIRSGLPRNWVDYLFVRDEKHLIAAIDAKLYQSSDGGDHWQMFSRLPNKQTVKAITQIDDRNLVIGVEDELYKSTDNGVTWHTMFADWPQDLWHPEIRDTLSNVQCVSESVCYVSFAYHGVYQTIDGGATWLPLSQGLSLPKYFGDMTATPGRLFIYGGREDGIPQQVYALDI